MVEVIRNTVQKAKKEYYDDGWDIIQEWVGEGCPIYLGESWNSPRGHLTFSEGRFLVQVRNRTIPPHKILPGQTYRSQFNKMDGVVYNWRTKEDFYQLICKYKLWPDY